MRSQLAAARPVQLVQADDPGQLARFEVRLARIEEELRQLTGRIEQLEFGNRALAQRIDQLVQDLDQRLLALEGGGARRKAPAPPPGRPAHRAPRRRLAPRGLRRGTSLGRAHARRRAAERAPWTAAPDPGAIPRHPRLPICRPQQQYDSAMQLLRGGDYAGAEGGLQLFLDLNPNRRSRRTPPTGSPRRTTCARTTRPPPRRSPATTACTVRTTPSARQFAQARHVVAGAAGDRQGLPHLRRAREGVSERARPHPASSGPGTRARRLRLIRPRPLHGPSSRADRGIGPVRAQAAPGGRGFRADRSSLCLCLLAAGGAGAGWRGVRC